MNKVSTFDKRVKPVKPKSKKPDELIISDEHAEICANIFRAINHGFRRTIINLLTTEGRPMKVSEIYTKLRVDQSVASQHLAILRKSGLVKPERVGKNIFYSIEDDIAGILQAVTKTIVEEIPVYHKV